MRCPQITSRVSPYVSKVLLCQNMFLAHLLNDQLVVRRAMHTEITDEKFEFKHIIPEIPPSRTDISTKLAPRQCIVSRRTSSDRKQTSNWTKFRSSIHTRDPTPGFEQLVAYCSRQRSSCKGLQGTMSRYTPTLAHENPQLCPQT
jgi:hypothetical protein